MTKLIRGQNDLLTVNPELSKEWNYDKNGELLPQMVTSHSGKKVWWICEKGHEWQATIEKRSAGKGCPYCSGRLVSDTNRLSIIKPDIAGTWDYEKNHPITPDTVSFSSNKKYWWKCTIGHSWYASCNSRSNGNSCPYCSGRIASSENNLATLFPELVCEWDYDKNLGNSPEEFTPYSGKQVWWICPKGHSYKKSIAKRSSGFGCPICSNRKVVCGVNDLRTTHPELSIEWNYQKNEPLTPECVHAGSTKKVWWKCTNGHQWEASIVNRARNRNCPYCSGKIASPEWNLATHSPEILLEWDYDRNQGVLPEEFTPYSNKKVWWKCEFGHSWMASINKRAYGSRCPKCWKEMRTSFPEQCVLYYLNKLFNKISNNYQFQFNNSTYEFDIFIHDLNVAIEYDGEYFHKNKLNADQRKNNIAKQAGISLYRIRETGCPEISGCFVIPVMPTYINNDFSNLENAIIILIKKLVHIDAIVCIEEDQNEIFQQYITLKKRRSFASTCPSLVEEWDYAKNGNLNPKNISFGSAKTVWWKCKKCGHEYKSSVNKRSHGRGCPACAGKIIIEGKNDLLTRYPLVAEDWNYEKNELTPNNVFPKSHKKAWWRCKKCGYECVQTIANRIKSNGCPICIKEKRKKKE